MLTKIKLRRQVMELTYRVAELEERLCPCEGHDWKPVGHLIAGGHGVGDEQIVYRYKCRRCGKKHQSLSRFAPGGVEDGKAD